LTTGAFVVAQQPATQMEAFSADRVKMDGEELELQDVQLLEKTGKR